MKCLFLFVFLIFSWSGFAACFEAPERVYRLPTTICFESMGINLDSGVIFIDDSTGGLPEMIPTFSLSRKNEDAFLFSAAHLLTEIEETCGDSIRGVLHLSGQTDALGNIFPELLSIRIDYEETTDSCHSRWRKGSLIFKLKSLK